MKRLNDLSEIGNRREEIFRQIKRLEFEKLELEYKELLEKVEPKIDYASLASIGQRNRLSDEVRFEYEELFRKMQTDLVAKIKKIVISHYEKENKLKQEKLDHEKIT